ncbi:helix-turn-helix transcriptional regulator [Serratia marcescens]|uniref:helix-turn-helix transcriptional regulator n=1 Tax=Serratia TaxID=613 RepID=UPI003BA05A5A
MPEMTVAIYDSNRFFALGVQHILRASFAARGWMVNFVAAERSVAADFVMRDESHLEGVYPCRVSANYSQARTTMIVVREATLNRRRPQIYCNGVQGALTRRDAPAALDKLVERLISAQGQMPAMAVACRHCRPPFTARERSVLRGFALGVDPAHIAGLLNMHVKTVSTHKRSAMRKLGFQLNTELYHWLRQGGLNDERGEPL